MTVSYLAIRYIGISYFAINVLRNMTLVLLTDAVSKIIGYTINTTNMAVFAMLGVIMIARLHAMYQGSRTILFFLVIIFLAINTAYGAITAIALKPSVGEELILSGAYICTIAYEGDAQLLASINWILDIIWEVLTLCLSVWIAVKHFRDLRRFGPSTGSTIGDCFKVLITSHVLYFASFVCISCLQLAHLALMFKGSNSIGAQMLFGVFQVVLVVQMFVLGPRLILSVREYHAKLVANSDAETSMNSIVYLECVHVSTSSSV
ncbi:hypothetical protein BD769DRAFT_1778418 [Suillus cothurnatus]|nr:hypothetical protein BD769DRAFT_1778418 [Suillus cothurnatus]